jgi:nickel-dependent lactate racemase
VRLEVHNPADRKHLAYLATTQAGRRIYLNRTAVEADQLVVLAGMQFDPMHGYGGAAALVYPALGDTETRHAWEKALTNEPPAEEAWPVRREAEEVLWLLGAPFLIQVIPGRDDEIAQVIAGASDSAASSRTALDARWRATTPRKANLVIAAVSGDPETQSMVFLARAAAAAVRVVEPGGTIVLMTDAQPTVGDGLGRAKEFAGPAAALAELHARPSADYPAAYQWLRAVAQGRVVLWSGLSDDESESLFATRLESPRQLQKLIDAASSCLILPDAHHLLAIPTTEE